ncbi:MAG: ribonuclease Z [Candidatus Micrarchaeota archaeon]|nr:ribonuclease Z [Candidatus Micrarchaeota archaeon]
MLSLTVLGSAASVPTLDRSLPSYAVGYEGKIFLLDCGEGTQRQLLKFSLSYSKISAIFISHLHLDHFLGLFGLFQTIRLTGLQSKIVVFGPKGLKKFFELFNVDKELVEVVELEKQKNPIFCYKSLEIFYYPISNHGVLSYAFLIKEKDKICFYEKKAKKLGLKGYLFNQIQKKGSLIINKKKVYLKDVSYIKKGKSILYLGDGLSDSALAKKLKDAKEVDLLIHDCTFDNNLIDLAKERFHSTPALAANFAKKLKAKTLLLTHISARYSKDPSILLTQAKKSFKNSILASDGLKIELK